MEHLSCGEKADEIASGSEQERKHFSAAAQGEPLTGGLPAHFSAPHG